MCFVWPACGSIVFLSVGCIFPFFVFVLCQAKANNFLVAQQRREDPVWTVAYKKWKACQGWKPPTLGSYFTDFAFWKGFRDCKWTTVLTLRFGSFVFRPWMPVDSILLCCQLQQAEKLSMLPLQCRCCLVPAAVLWGVLHRSLDPLPSIRFAHGETWCVGAPCQGPLPFCSGGSLLMEHGSLQWFGTFKACRKIKIIDSFHCSCNMSLCRHVCQMSHYWSSLPDAGV